ncbi:MAG: EamA family transporter [Spirochaetaceae bacterium]|nr:EamA family transporter [Spirochaetaceae bacterium]
MSNANGAMYYISALIGVIGAAAYQIIVKKVPSDLNPLVSIVGIYLAVLPISLILLFVFGRQENLIGEFHKLNWRQPAMAVAVIMMELGFLLMYRNGWTLSTGNLVTGAVINIILVVVEVAFMGARLNLKSIIGILLCMVGVSLLNAR